MPEIGLARPAGSRPWRRRTPAPSRFAISPASEHHRRREGEAGQNSNGGFEALAHLRGAYRAGVSGRGARFQSRYRSGRQRAHGR